MIMFMQRIHYMAFDMLREPWKLVLDRYIERQREQVGAVDATVSEARRGFDVLPPRKSIDTQVSVLISEMLGTQPKPTPKPAFIGAGIGMTSSYTVNGNISAFSLALKNARKGSMDHTQRTPFLTSPRSRKQDLGNMFRVRTQSNNANY
jgi:hypothetical protein